MYVYVCMCVKVTRCMALHIGLATCTRVNGLGTDVMAKASCIGTNSGNSIRENGLMAFRYRGVYPLGVVHLWYLGYARGGIQV